MENKKILVTGGKGYLASNLLKNLSKNNDIILYDGDIRIYKQYKNIDIILHFASPSDIYEFTNKEKTATTIVDGTINLLKVAKYNNAKFIFASTMGVYFNIENVDNYSTYKLAMENYIKSVYNNYIILRIPRVYSKCRKKGLMRQIRENVISEDDNNNIIEYITLSDFIEQTFKILDCKNITHEYKITNSKSIKEIKRWIKKY